MKYILNCFWLIFLLNISCSNPGQQDTAPPEKVQMVHRLAGADTTDAEAGIDAVANPDSVNYIQLMWYRPRQTADLAYFNIYRSEDEQGAKNYNLLYRKELNQEGVPDTLYIDTQDLHTNVRYYYYVTTVNKDGLESENSDTLSYTLLEKAGNLSLNGNSGTVSEPSMEFSWWINSGQTPDKYILRIEAFVTEDFHPKVYVQYIQSTYQTPQSLTLSGNWLTQTFPTGKYRWRIDCVGDEDVAAQWFKGSESDWYPFNVNWSDNEE